MSLVYTRNSPLRFLYNFVSAPMAKVEYPVMENCEDAVKTKKKKKNSKRLNVFIPV